MKTHALRVALSTHSLGAGLIHLDDAAKERAKTRDAIGYNAESTLVLPVKDLKEALAWYQRTLGFETIFVAEEIGFAEVASPVDGLAFGLSQRPEFASGDSAVTLGVADMDRARKALEARGVKFLGEPMVYPGLVKLSYFADPWGNNLMLHQSLAEQEK